MPTLVHFFDGVPIIYPGDFDEESEVLEWIVNNLDRSEIEDVSASVLDYLIDTHDHLVVIFYEENEDESQDDDEFLQIMEGLDDDCDNMSITVVKVIFFNFQ